MWTFGGELLNVSNKRKSIQRCNIYPVLRIQQWTRKSDMKWLVCCREGQLEEAAVGEAAAAGAAAVEEVAAAAAAVVEVAMEAAAAVAAATAAQGKQQRKQQQ